MTLIFQSCKNIINMSHELSLSAKLRCWESCVLKCLVRQYINKRVKSEVCVKIHFPCLSEISVDQKEKNIIQIYDQIQRRYNSRRKKIHCSFKILLKKFFSINCEPNINFLFYTEVWSITNHRILNAFIQQSQIWTLIKDNNQTDF